MFYDICKLMDGTKSPRLQLQWEYKGNSFKNWLMSEITKDLANQLITWQKDNPNDLPFSDIFGPTNLRITIPLVKDKEATDILDKLEKTGLKIDFEKGLVQNGKREVRLGKFILSKISPFTESEKKWWKMR